MTLLAAAGLVGVGLAIHGYGHGAVIAAGPGGVGVPASVAGSHAKARATSQSTSSSSKAKSSSSKTKSSSSKAKSPSSTASSQKLGPLLSSTQYAPYTFRIYPTPESSQARLATAGFTIQVTPHTGTIAVSVSAAGSGQGAQTSTFPASDRVYFVEAAFGDDSGGADYNFGDDGVVVTNAHGYLVQ